MELASRADQRVLRWFGHVERIDEYRMARSVLMTKVSGRWVRGINCKKDAPCIQARLDAWCEGGLRQQRNDGEGCATMRERSERVESPGTYITE